MSNQQIATAEIQQKFSNYNLIVFEIIIYDLGLKISTNF